MTTTTMHSQDQFDDRFDPVDSPSGEIVWSRQEVLDALADGTIGATQAWTVVDGDEGCDMHALAGLHVVNAVGYSVTRNGWTSEEEQAVWHEADCSGCDHED